MIRLQVPGASREKPSLPAPPGGSAPPSEKGSRGFIPAGGRAELSGMDSSRGRRQARGRGGILLFLLFFFLLFLPAFPARAQEGERKVTLRTALDEGIVKLGVQGLGPDKIRINLQSLVLRKLRVRVPRGSLFGPSLVINAGRQVNRVQEMVTLNEEWIPLDPKRLVSRDLPAACADLWARIPMPWHVLSYRPRKKAPGAESLFPVFEKLDLPWEVRQAALWILTDDATFREMNRPRPKHPRGFGPRKIPPRAYAAAMMAVERSGRSLAGRRCGKDSWVLVPAARPCLYPPWARLLSAWALAKLHARGYAGPYPKVLLEILERDRDPMLCLEAFKAAAAAPGPGTLAAMRKYLDRFPKPPPGAGFSPMRVYLAMARSTGWRREGNRAAAPPAAGGAPSPLSADLDHLLAEIRGGGPETERDLRILAKMGKSLDDPRARVQVGKTLAVLLERGGLFPGTALVEAVGAFRDTWSLGGLLRLLARRGKARPETRCVWVRLVALYPDWAATRWLVDRLSDPDRRVRAEAARMLRKRPDAVGPLLSLAAGGRTLTLRLAALDALASPSGARNFPLRRAVARLLADSSDQVREKALQLLLLWKCREALPQMLTLCAEDPSQRVRWAAARGLQVLGDQRTAAKIRALLSSPGVHSRELRFALAGIKAGK